MRHDNLASNHRRARKLLVLVVAVTALVTTSSGIAMAVDRSDRHEQPNTADVAALNKLEADFHLAGSTQNIDLLMSLFAEDGSFVGGPGNLTYVGRTDVGKGFLKTGAYLPGNDWAGLTPSYRIKIKILNSHQATMYFECDYVDKATLQVKAQIGVNTTEVRRHGQWLFKTFTGGPAPQL